MAESDRISGAVKVYHSGKLDDDALRALVRRNPPPSLQDLGLVQDSRTTGQPSAQEGSGARLAQECLEIFERVQKEGDDALRDYTLRWDDAAVETFGVSAAELGAAWTVVADGPLQSLKRAVGNIYAFHEKQVRQEDPVTVEEGIECWRESRPIETVGLYVPGGLAALPSTVLMLGVPARLAGCARVILCVPPARDGTVSAEVLVACQLVGIEEVFRVGGAHAIAAMSMGTRSIPKVEKIFGPGNRRVQIAKIIASLRGTAIDMFAGPSEVLVIADRTALPEFIASDLLAQAEHDCDSRAVLVSNSAEVVARTGDQLRRQIEDLPRKTEVEAALEKSFALVTESIDEAFSFSNLYAPEHLILHLENPRSWTGRVTSAGSVFLGGWSPEVAGDYATGTNHTLPTSGLARTLSGVSVDSFVKKITFQQLSGEALTRLGPTLETLARMEGLEAHRQAVARRVRYLAEGQGSRNGSPENSV